MPADYGTVDAFLKAVGVPLAIAVAVVIWLIEMPQGLLIQGHKAFVPFGGIFVLYLTEAIPLAIANLLVVPATTLTGVDKPKDALDDLILASIYLIIVLFILTTALPIHPQPRSGT